MAFSYTYNCTKAIVQSATAFLVAEKIVPLQICYSYDTQTVGPNKTTQFIKKILMLTALLLIIIYIKKNFLNCILLMGRKAFLCLFLFQKTESKNCHQVINLLSEFRQMVVHNSYFEFKNSRFIENISHFFFQFLIMSKQKSTTAFNYFANVQQYTRIHFIYQNIIESMFSKCL